MHVKGGREETLYFQHIITPQNPRFSRVITKGRFNFGSLWLILRSGYSCCTYYNPNTPRSFHTRPDSSARKFFRGIDIF